MTFAEIVAETAKLKAARKEFTAAAKVFRTAKDDLGVNNARHLIPTKNVSGEAAGLLNREFKANRALEKRKPEQWVALIEKIEDRSIRLNVGCLVYWDYFGIRAYKERWPHLDKMIERDPPPATREALVEGLVAVGYTPSAALARIPKNL
jgi:hypothetical protein